MAKDRNGCDHGALERRLDAIEGNVRRLSRKIDRLTFAQRRCVLRCIDGLADGVITATELEARTAGADLRRPAEVISLMGWLDAKGVPAA